MTPAILRLPLLMALLLFPSAAAAHVVDEYLQATLVSIAADRIVLQLNLTPGQAIADDVLTLIDLDGNGAISPAEATAYAQCLLRDLKLRLDQRDIELKLITSRFASPAELRTGEGIIRIEFAALLSPLAPGPHKLRLENRHLPAVGIYLVNATKPGSRSIEITRQSRNDMQSTAEIEFTVGSGGSPSGASGLWPAPTAAPRL